MAPNHSFGPGLMTWSKMFHISWGDHDHHYHHDFWSSSWFLIIIIIIMIPDYHHSLPPLLHGNSDGRRWDQHQSHHPGFKKSSLLLQSCYNLLFPYTYNSWTLCPYISHAEGYLKIVRKRFGKLWIELQHLRRRSLWRCQNINHHHHGP